MKTPLRTSLILMFLLAVVDLGFQSCGFSSSQSGNGVGYESRVPPGQAIVAEFFAYAGTCADPNAVEARIQKLADGYALTDWDCAVLTPAEAVDAREVETQTNAVRYRGRTFVRENAP